MWHLSAIAFLCFACTACFVSEELPADQEAWSYDLPSNQGMSDNALGTLNYQIGIETYGQIDGMIIIKNDHLIFENYFNNGDRHDLLPLGRATTAIATLVLGLMIEQGYIANLDVPIFNYLPEYQNIFDADSYKQQITFRHLLNNQLGVAWNEYIVNTERTESDFYQMQLQSDWAAYILSKKQEVRPGRRLVLNSGSAIILSKIFENILSDVTLEEFIKKEIFEPMNIVGSQWEYDPSGTLNLYSGLSLSALDFTRLGYLMLQEGRWVNKRRIINRDWILDATASQVAFLPQLDFGFFWWSFTDQFNSLYTNGRETYFITGYRGQTVYVAPDENLVVTIMANNPYNNIIYNHSLNVYLQIIDSINLPLENP